MPDTNDVIRAFRDSMQEAGLTPPESIEADGQLHRYSTGERGSDDAGWYVLFLDEIPAGSFGDWRSGVKVNWCSRRDDELSDDERRMAYDRQQEARRRSQQAREAAQTETAEYARQVWENAEVCPEDHPYLVAKGVQSYGLRVDREALLIPVSDRGEIISLQRIFPDGSKRFMKNGRTAGGAFMLGTMDPLGTVVICEGYATGATIRQATGLAVICAYNATNLVPVARRVRERAPGADIIIAADDDFLTFEPVENPGVTKAREAARLTGARVAIPEFDPTLRTDGDTDFNDLWRTIAGAEGEEHAARIVAGQIAGAVDLTQPVEVEAAEAAPAEVDPDPTPAPEPTQTQTAPTPTATATATAPAPTPTADDETVRDISLMAELFVNAQTHGTGADIVVAHFAGTVIFDPFDTQGRGQFFQRVPGRCYFKIVYDIHQQCRVILERYIKVAEESLSSTNDDIKALYEAIGKAYVKVRTRTFLHGVVQMVSEAITVPEIQWNAIAEVLPTKTELIDFTGKAPRRRMPHHGEYFRDPLPLDAEEVFQAAADSEPVIPAFDRFMNEVFPDKQTRQTALHVAALGIANKPRKSFIILHNAEGNGAKNSFVDVLSRTVPGRIKSLSGSVVTTDSDKSERRFAASVGEACTMWVFDEISGSFDVPAIKRFTSLSPVLTEKKGRDPREITPTWVLVAMANELPKFNPPDDQAFLSRLIVVPFTSVFYADTAEYDRYIKAGVAEDRLHPQRDKAEILAEIEAERPGILAKLIAEYLVLRQKTGGTPVESAECLRSKEIYRTQNDYIEGFFEDSLQRLDGARMTYNQVRALFEDYMGGSKIKMSSRKLVDEITRRYRFIERGKSNGERCLVNVGERFEYGDEGGGGDPF